jgi:hypothetical protein
MSECRDALLTTPRRSPHARFFLGSGLSSVNLAYVKEEIIIL